jgi:hypothetical protein
MFNSSIVGIQTRESKVTLYRMEIKVLNFLDKSREAYLVVT